MDNIMSYYNPFNHFSNGQEMRTRYAFSNFSILQQIISTSCAIPELTGNSTVCFANITYTLQNGGSNITWQVSSNLQIVSSTNTQVIVKSDNPTTSAMGYVEAVLPYETLRKEVFVGKFIPPDIRLRNPHTNNPIYAICSDRPTYVQATHDFWDEPDDWQWNVSGAYITYDNPYQNNSKVTLRPYSLNVSVQIRAKNDCGWSSWVDVSPSIMPWCGMYYVVYPNPTSETLTIKRNGSSDLTKYSHHYNLYDFNGKLVQEGLLGNQNIINVSNFVKGRYILIIQTGKKEEQHHIVIN